MQINGLEDMLACMQAMDLKSSTMDDLTQRLQDMRMAVNSGVLPGLDVSSNGGSVCDDQVSLASSGAYPIMAEDNWPTLPGRPGVVISDKPVPRRNRYAVLDSVY
jgi:hypothetical protein